MIDLLRLNTCDWLIVTIIRQTLSGDVYEPMATTAATIITPTRAKDSTDDEAFIALGDAMMLT